MGHVPAVATTGDGSWPVLDSTTEYSSGYLTLAVDTIRDPQGQTHDRVVVRPHTAVGVVAQDEQGRILLIEQYRHAMGRRMLEIPAGLMDVDGESARRTAERELAEETDLVAGTWRELLTVAPTVGYSTEVITIFAASDLSPVLAPDRTTREAEEADIAPWWVTVDEAVAACLDGRVVDAKTVIAVLAVARA